MKSPRWRAVNKAYNRDGWILTVRESVKLRDAYLKGEAIVVETLMDAGDGESFTLRSLQYK